MYILNDVKMKIFAFITFILARANADDRHVDPTGTGEATPYSSIYCLLSTATGSLAACGDWYINWGYFVLGGDNTNSYAAKPTDSFSTKNHFKCGGATAYLTTTSTNLHIPAGTANTRLKNGAAAVIECLDQCETDTQCTYVNIDMSSAETCHYYDSAPCCADAGAGSCDAGSAGGGSTLQADGDIHLWVKRSGGVVCAQDVRTCRHDGSVVSRDPNNNCKFPACPKPAWATPGAHENRIKNTFDTVHQNEPKPNFKDVFLDDNDFVNNMTPEERKNLKKYMCRQFRGHKMRILRNTSGDWDHGGIKVFDGFVDDHRSFVFADDPEYEGGGVVVNKTNAFFFEEYCEIKYRETEYNCSTTRKTAALGHHKTTFQLKGTNKKCTIDGGLNQTSCFIKAAFGVKFTMLMAGSAGVDVDNYEDSTTIAALDDQCTLKGGTFDAKADASVDDEGYLGGPEWSDCGTNFDNCWQNCFKDVSLTECAAACSAYEYCADPNVFDVINETCTPGPTNKCANYEYNVETRYCKLLEADTAQWDMAEDESTLCHCTVCPACGPATSVYERLNTSKVCVVGRSDEEESNTWTTIGIVFGVWLGLILVFEGLDRLIPFWHAPHWVVVGVYAVKMVLLVPCNSIKAAAKQGDSAW